MTRTSWTCKLVLIKRQQVFEINENGCTVETTHFKYRCTLLNIYLLQYFNRDINAFLRLNVSLYTMKQCYKSIISNFLYFSKVSTTYFNFEKYNDQNRWSESIFSFENLPLNNTNIIASKK